MPQVTIDATTSDVDAGANPSWTHIPGSGISLVTIIASSGASLPSNVTYGGVACTTLDTGQCGPCYGGIFYLKSPSQGNQTVSVTADAQAYAACTSWKFTHPTDPVSVASELVGDGADGSSSIAIAGKAKGVIQDSIYIDHNPGTITMGADQTSIIAVGGDPKLYSSYETCTDTSNHTMSWTWESEQECVQHAIAIYALPSGGSQVIWLITKKYADLLWRLRRGLPLPEWYLRRQQPTWMAALKHTWATA